MKNILCILVFILFVTILSTEAIAQEELSPVVETSPTPTPIEYQLPYPGILPDSPLYTLKVVRDRIVGFLIAGSLKKAEFNLLQADKRLNAGVFLFKKGNVELAESTISKGENYFEQAIQSVKEAQRQGQNTQDILERMSHSLEKHMEVLQDMEKNLPKDTKKETREGIRILIQRVEESQKDVVSMMPQE